MAGGLDPKVVALGAALQIAVSVPPAILVSALRQDDVTAQSNLWLVAAVLALVVGPAAAGVLVRRKRPDAPLLHAAAATAAAWALLALVSVTRTSLRSGQVAALLVTLLTIAPIQVGIGVLGAFFSRPPRAPEEIDP